MKEVQNIFQKQSERLFYLDMKKPIEIGDKKYENLSLPIVREDFMQEIESGSFEEEISFQYFIKGMIFNISIDPDFMYCKTYKELLSYLIPNLDQYLFTQGLKELEYSKDAIHYFRTNYILGTRMTLNSYYYVISLESLDEDEGGNTIETRRWLLDDILEEDDKFGLAYYRMGLYDLREEDFENAFKSFTKAKEYLQKETKLPKTYVEKIEAEIDVKLEELNSDALLKKAVEYLDQGKLYESLSILKNLNQRMDSSIIKYYLGYNYRNLQELNLAIEYYEEALDMNFKGVELYQDLSYCYFAIGEIQKAFRVLEGGLEEYKDEERLLYNRAALYANLGEYTKALEDIEILISYHDISDMIFNETMILKEQILERMETE